MKKILIAFLTILALISSVFVFISCSDDKEPDESDTTKTETSDVNEKPTHIHEYGEWKTVKEVNCKEDGTEERFCTCGEKQSRTISATEHVMGEWVIDKNATCAEPGIRHSECTKCLSVVTEEIPVTDHNSGYYVSVTEPTCTEPGLGERRCEYCDAVLETFERSSHNHMIGSFKTTVEATCTTPGQKQKKCIYCDTVLLTEEIPARGHSGSYNSETTVEATCTAPGQRQETCRTCGEVMATETIPAFGHSYTTSQVWPKCEVPGGTKYSCKRCSDSYIEYSGEPYGHNLAVSGICTTCEKDFSVDMKTRVSAPIEDFYIEPGTIMDLTAKAYNNSGKVIKYYWVHFIAYNTVGDVIYQTTEKWTGPVNPGEVLSFTKRGTKGFMYWKVDFSECGKLEIANIKLEYTDGTIESGPYGYSTTEIK